MPSANSRPVRPRAGRVDHQLLERRRGAGAHVRLRSPSSRQSKRAERAAELEDDAAHAAVADQHVGADAEDDSGSPARAAQRAAASTDLRGARHLDPRIGGPADAERGVAAERLAETHPLAEALAASQSRTSAPIAPSMCVWLPTRLCTSSSATPWMLPAPSTTTMSPTCSSG